MRPMTSCSAASAFQSSVYAQEIEVALKAVRAGAFLTTGVQKDLKKSQETSQKADDSPVTVADYAAQAVVSWCVAHPSAYVKESPPVSHPDLLHAGTSALHSRMFSS